MAESRHRSKGSNTTALFLGSPERAFDFNLSGVGALSPTPSPLPWQVMARFLVDNKYKLYMKKMLDVIVETGKDGFGCFVANGSGLTTTFVGQGKTARLAIQDFLQAYREVSDISMEEHEDFPELEFNFIFDIGAFFNYYPLSVSAFARYIGMNESLLRQYVSGAKSPSAKTLARVREGLDSLGKDIGSGLLVSKPVYQYA